MGIREEIIRIAASQDGMTEDPPNSNSIPYWDWWANGDGVVEAWEINGPWCGAFVSWVYDQAGAPLPPIQRDRGGFMAVAKGTEYAFWAGEIVQGDPLPGDIALYSWYPITWGEGGYPWVWWTDPATGRSGWYTAGDHTGIFERMEGDAYMCWEGNTSIYASQDNGGSVHCRPRYDSDIIYFWRPAVLATATPATPSPSPSPSVPSEEDDYMLQAFKLANDPHTVWIRDPKNGKVYTVNQLTAVGHSAEDTLNELMASGMCRWAVPPERNLGWLANWAIGKVDERV